MIVETADYESLKNINSDSLRKLYARKQVLLNELNDTILFPVQAIRIGNGIIGGLGEGIV